MAIDITYSHSVFRGQIHCPAPVTPFAANGDLMLDAFAELLRWYIDDVNVDGLLIAGSNGEGYVLNAEELGKVTETVVETVKGRVPFFVHVSRIASRETIVRAQIVAEAGAPGLCLTGQPYIQTATKAEIVERFEKVAKAVPLPVMVYNSFTHQQFNITPDVMRALCDVAPICVVKDSPPTFKEALALFVELGDRFPILHGISATLVPSLLLGFGGLVSTGPELFGSKCRELFEVHDMTPAERTKVNGRYGLVKDAMMLTATPPAAIKGALNMVGLPAGVPRDPVKPLMPREEAHIRDILTQVGILDGPVAKRA